MKLHKQLRFWWLHLPASLAVGCAILAPLFMWAGWPPWSIIYIFSTCSVWVIVGAFVVTLARNSRVVG